MDKLTLSNVRQASTQAIRRLFSVIGGEMRHTSTRKLKQMSPGDGRELDSSNSPLIICAFVQYSALHRVGHIGEEGSQRKACLSLIPPRSITGALWFVNDL